jgi:hypothetical protein
VTAAQALAEEPVVVLALAAEPEVEQA